MNESDIGDLFAQAVWTTILVGGPVVFATMLVGTVVAVLQALTQIQEATLTFVPKLAALVATLALTSNFIFSHLKAFAEDLFMVVQTGFPG